MSTRKEPPADINQGRKRALIICVSDYDNKLESLAFCKNDGEKMYELLQSLDYAIPEKYRLIGRVNHEPMKKAIQDFFMKEVRSKDTLLLYFSGHGIPEDNGVHYLATSEIDPEEPYDKGYKFEDLEQMMDRSVSTRKVVMLDCCYSGAARPGGKGGNEEEAATLGREAINNTIKAGEGKCVLASSLSYQKSYASKEQEHSIFTYYLMDGLKGNKESVNSDGTITPDTLGRYVFDRVTEKLPKQKPIRKVEASGDIILAYYPHLAKHELERVNASSSLSPSASAEIYWKMEEIDEYERNEDYDSAIPCYQEAIAIDPHNYRLHNRMGKAYFNLGRDQDAIEAYHRAISARPEHPDAYDLKGDVYFKLEDYKKALESYDKAWKIRPKSFEFLKDKGLAHYSLKEYEQAVEYLGKALEIKPEQSKIKEIRKEAHLKLQEVDELEKGISLYNSGKHDEALECFKRSLEANPNNAQTLYYKGLILAHQSQLDKAITCYEEALKIDPKYDAAQKAKESAIEEQRQKEISTLIADGRQYSKISDYQNAIDSYDKAIELDPQTYVPYFEKGNAQAELKEYDEALECYTKAIQIKPDHYYTWYSKGEVLCKKGDDFTSAEASKLIECFNEAKKCYDEALKIDQNKAEAWYRKGSILKKLNSTSKLESRDEEIEYYDKALRIRPDYAEVYYDKGQALADLEKYKEAIECFEEALKTKSPYHEALKAKESAEFKIAEDHYIQGQALSDSMKYEEAIESFNKALKIKPTYDKALKAKEATQQKQLEKETSLIIDEGLKYLNNGDYDNADASFDKAIAIRPESEIASSLKGSLYFKLEDYKKAVEYYDKVLKINPKNFDALKDKGLAFYKLKEYDQALEFFDKALKIKPDQSIILQYKKEVLQNLEEIDEQKSLKYDISDQHISTILQEALQYAKRSDYQNAIDSFDRAIILDPKNYLLYYLKGNILLKLENYEMALACYDMSLLHKPYYYHTWFNKGNSLFKLGKYEEAIMCYDKALALKPNQSTILEHKKEALSILEKIDKPRLKNKTIVFISYTREDRESAEKLATAMKNTNLEIEPWMDTEIRPGEVWEKEIKKAIEASRYFIPLFSSRTVEKTGYTRKEFEYALSVIKETRQRKKIIVIPVRLDDCKIPYSQLEKIQWVDLFPDWNQGFQEIQDAIELGDNLIGTQKMSTGKKRFWSRK